MDKLIDEIIEIVLEDMDCHHEVDHEEDGIHTSVDYSLNNEEKIRGMIGKLIEGIDAVQLPEITEAWTDAKAKEIKALIVNAQDEDLSDPVMSLHYLGLSLDIVTSIINDLRPRK